MKKIFGSIFAVLIAFIFCFIFLISCSDSNNDSKFKQTPPPYLPNYGYILKPDVAQNLILGPYGQLNLEYYISKSDFKGFSDYIETNIIPYIESLPIHVLEANLSKVTTTLSYMNAWLYIIENYELEGLIVIRNESFIKIGE